MSQPFATITFSLAAGYNLEPLTLNIVNQEVANAYSQAYGALTAAAQAGQDYSSLTPALFDNALGLMVAAFIEPGFQINDPRLAVDTANGVVEQLKAELANLQAQAQTAVNDAYAKGVADQKAQGGSPAAAAAPEAGNSVIINLDYAAVAARIVAALNGGVAAASGVAVNSQTTAGTAQQTGGFPGAGGLVLGGPGKPDAARETSAQPGVALGAVDSEAAKLLAMDPSLIGDGSGSGGGMPRSEETGALTVKAVRDNNDLMKVSLPNANKQFAVGAVVYILPSSVSAQWDDKHVVIADPKQCDSLDVVSEGAKTSLMKTLHYYVSK